jgi:hypothetical protein
MEALGDRQWRSIRLTASMMQYKKVSKFETKLGLNWTSPMKIVLLI